MAVNTISSTTPSFTDNLVDKATEAIQKKGVEIIQKTLQNSNLNEDAKNELVNAQMKAFGVTQTMLDQTNATQATQDNQVTQTSNNQALKNITQTQQNGLDIIQKTLDMKINDQTKDEIVQAQMKAFGVTQEMVDATNKTTQEPKATTDNTTTNIELTQNQQNGLKALLNDLNSNLDDSTKKELLKQDIKSYDLNQNMINQVIEQFADGNQEKYVQAKTLFGSNMGFDLTA